MSRAKRLFVGITCLLLSLLLYAAPAAGQQSGEDTLNAAESTVQVVMQQLADLEAFVRESSARMSADENTLRELQDKRQAEQAVMGRLEADNAGRVPTGNDPGVTEYNRAKAAFDHYQTAISALTSQNQIEMIRINNCLAKTENLRSMLSNAQAHQQAVRNSLLDNLR